MIWLDDFPTVSGRNALGVKEKTDSLYSLFKLPPARSEALTVKS